MLAYRCTSSCAPALRLRPSVPAVRQPVRAQSTSAPKQGYHTVADDLRAEALELFFSAEDEATCTPTTGGVNNVVEYVDSKRGRFILRIYNNGGKSDKVVYEHAVLDQLALQELSVQVPTTVKSKAGRSHEPLSNGAEACVFNIIPGTLAKTTSPEEVGRATGELNTAMGKLRLDMEPPIAPYFELFKVHHTIDGDAEMFYRSVEAFPELQDPACKDAVDYLVGQIKHLAVKIEDFKALGVPKQIIHGDVHYDNILVVGDKVSGILDFEFCSYDWRAMELAVALSKYVGEDAPLPLCEEYVAGYAQHCHLTEDEMMILPDLINLRIASNVVYFTSRALGKEDTIEALSSRAATYAKRIRWVNSNREALTNVVKSKMAQLAGAKA